MSMHLLFLYCRKVKINFRIGYSIDEKWEKDEYVLLVVKIFNDFLRKNYFMKKSKCFFCEILGFRSFLNTLYRKLIDSLMVVYSLLFAY